MIWHRCSPLISSSNFVSMTNKMRAREKPASATSKPSRVRSGRWVFYAGAVVTLLVVGGAIFLGKQKWFGATNVDTSADHAHGSHSSGPRAVGDSNSRVGTNSAPPPGLAPDGMVWIP